MSITDEPKTASQFVKSFYAAYAEYRNVGQRPYSPNAATLAVVSDHLVLRAIVCRLSTAGANYGPAKPA